jgi:hypothetical protein
MSGTLTPAQLSGQVSSLEIGTNPNATQTIAAASANASIPHPAVPLTGPGGSVTPQWYLYWTSLFGQTGPVTNNNTTIAPTGELSLEDLSDVQIIGVADGQVLTWNAQKQRWVNGSILQGEVFVFEGLTTGLITTIDLAGDLSIIVGNAPIPVQLATLDAVGASGGTLSLANAPTLENTLILAQFGVAEIGGTPAGFTAIASGGGIFNQVTIYSAPVLNTTGQLFPVPGEGAIGSSTGYILREFSGIFQIGSVAMVQFDSVPPFNTIIGPPFGGTEVEQSLYYGAFVMGGQTIVSPPPNFFSPGPPGAQIGPTIFGNANFEGAPVVGCDVFLPSGNGQQQLSVTATEFGSVGGAGMPSGGAFVQLIGFPNNTNTATLVGTPTFVVDGQTILPTLSTEGMLQYEGGGLLGAFITIENSGTVANSLVTNLDFSGAGVTLGGTAATESVSIPGGVSAEVGTVGGFFPTVSVGEGLEFSGTSPNLTIGNTGVLEIQSGTATLTGILSLGSGLTNVGNAIVAEAADSTWTNGTIAIINPLEISIGSGLTLSASGITPPTLVQIAAFGSQFGALPISGNLLVIVASGNSNSTPVGWTLQSSAGVTNGFTFVYSQESTGVFPNLLGSTQNQWTMYEVSGVGAANFFSGPLSLSGDNFTFTAPSGSFLLSAFAVAPGSNTISAPLPAGSIIDEQFNGPFGDFEIGSLRSPVNATSSVIGATCSAAPTSGFIAGVAITGNSGGVAEISSGGGSSGGITEFIQGSLTATGAATLGSGLTLSGTLNPTLTSSGGGGIVAEVGTVSSTFSTIDAGANISFSGTSPNLTISASSTASSNLTFENGGTSVGTAGTLNAGSGTALAVSGGVATISATGGGGVVALFSSQTVSAVTEVNFTGLAPGFDYFLVANSLNTSEQLALIFGSGTGPTWINGAGDYSWDITSKGSNFNSPEAAIFLSFSNAVFVNQSFKIDIIGAIEDVVPQAAVGFCSQQQSSFSGVLTTPSAITALQVSATSGTLSGNFYLYSRAR